MRVGLLRAGYWVYNLHHYGVHDALRHDDVRHRPAVLRVSLCAHVGGVRGNAMRVNVRDGRHYLWRSFDVLRRRVCDEGC